MKRIQSYIGMTLIELLAVMCCMAVVMMWTVDGFTNLLSRYHTHLLKNQLAQVIQYSRLTTISKGRDLALNALNDDWSYGIVLFVDNAQHHFTPQDEVIQFWKWDTYGIHIAWLGFQSKQFIVFSHDLTRAASNGQFQFTQANHVVGKLILNRLGRVVVN